MWHIEICTGGEDKFLRLQREEWEPFAVALIPVPVKIETTQNGGPTGILPNLTPVISLKKWMTKANCKVPNCKLCAVQPSEMFGVDPDVPVYEMTPTEDSGGNVQYIPTKKGADDARP